MSRLPSTQAVADEALRRAQGRPPSTAAQFNNNPRADAGLLSAAGVPRTALMQSLPASRASNVDGSKRKEKPRRAAANTTSSAARDGRGKSRDDRYLGESRGWRRGDAPSDDEDERLERKMRAASSKNEFADLMFEDENEDEDRQRRRRQRKDNNNDDNNPPHPLAPTPMETLNPLDLLRSQLQSVIPNTRSAPPRLPLEALSSSYHASKPAAGAGAAPPPPPAEQQRQQQIPAPTAAAVAPPVLDLPPPRREFAYSGAPPPKGSLIAASSLRPYGAMRLVPPSRQNHNLVSRGAPAAAPAPKDSPLMRVDETSTPISTSAQGGGGGGVAVSDQFRLSPAAVTTTTILPPNPRIATISSPPQAPKPPQYRFGLFDSAVSGFSTPPTMPHPIQQQASSTDHPSLHHGDEGWEEGVEADIAMMNSIGGGSGKGGESTPSTAYASINQAELEELKRRAESSVLFTPSLHMKKKASPTFVYNHAIEDDFKTSKILTPPPNIFSKKNNMITPSPPLQPQPQQPPAPQPFRRNNRLHKQNNNNNTNDEPHKPLPRTESQIKQQQKLEQYVQNGNMARTANESKRARQWVHAMALLSLLSSLLVVIQVELGIREPVGVEGDNRGLEGVKGLLMIVSFAMTGRVIYLWIERLQIMVWQLQRGIAPPSQHATTIFLFLLDVAINLVHTPPYCDFTMAVPYSWPLPPGDPYRAEVVVGSIVLCRLYWCARSWKERSVETAVALLIIGSREKVNTRGFGFHARRLMHVRPVMAPLTVLLIIIIWVGYLVRMFEVPFDTVQFLACMGGDGDSATEANCLSRRMIWLWNDLWLTICTISSVGYGDYYPVTHMGRLATFLGMFMGLVLSAILIAVASQECNFNHTERTIAEMSRQSKRDGDQLMRAIQLIQRVWRVVLIMRREEVKESEVILLRTLLRRELIDFRNRRLDTMRNTYAKAQHERVMLEMALHVTHTRRLAKGGDWRLWRSATRGDNSMDRIALSIQEQGDLIQEISVALAEHAQNNRDPMRVA